MQSKPVSRTWRIGTRGSQLALAQAHETRDRLMAAHGLPAEAFEISAGEIMGNCYDRLIRYDVADPSKLLPDLATSWKVAEDGRTYSFELRPGVKFASGNPLGAEDVVFSLQRAVLLDKTPAFILTQFGFAKDNVRERIKGKVILAKNDIYTTEDLANDWILTCQGHCFGAEVEITYDVV